MSDACSFIQLLPEVQDALSPHFSLVDCSLGLGPDLSRPPFNRPFRNLGQQVTYVPDSTVVEDLDRTSQHEIILGEKSLVLTDSTEGTVMEIALEGGSDWLTPLSLLFHNIFQSKWTFLVAEVENGVASFHVISSKGSISDKPKEVRIDGKTANYSIWIVPVSKIFAIPPPVKKVKIVKKVVKKKSPVEGETTDGVKKVVKKKKVETCEDTPANTSNGSNGETAVKKEEKSEKKVDSNGNGDIHVNGTEEEKTVSISHDITHSSSLAHSSEKEREGILNGGKENGSNGFSSHSNTESSPSINTFLPSTLSSARKEKKEEDSSDDEDIAAKLRREIMERDRLNRLGEDPLRKDSLIRRPSSRSPTRALGPISETRPRMARRSSDDLPPPSDIPIGRSGTFMKPRSFDISPPRTPSLPIPSPSPIPVLALQIVLRSKFSYEEMGRLRAVHPHWDEICGQLLNGGYYALLERTDRLLMKYQRRVHSDSALHYPVALLTNIQVHILNPVDTMRAALDEGICCFPYGVIIDKTLLLLDEIERMVAAGENRDVPWEAVGVLAKRASFHYRSHLEEVMEERMGTCARLKAAHRIIRMDSMIVEHNVNKLEKESVRARDDLRWELEQVQQSNGQLKKENRQLKADQMRLESRIESLENKLRSICRLLS